MGTNRAPLLSNISFSQMTQKFMQKLMKEKITRKAIKADRYSRVSCPDFLERWLLLNNEATEPRVPTGLVELISSQDLRSPP